MRCFRVLTACVMITFASMSAVSEDTLKRQPGESYIEYVERYKNLSAQRKKLNEMRLQNEQSASPASGRRASSFSFLPEVNSERRNIVDACRKRLGEYGASIVKTCADNGIEALIALRSYPQQHAPIVKSCYERLKEYGYQIVKTCADNDIEAEQALRSY